MEDRTSYIMKNLQEKYDFLINKGYEVVALFLQGSQNYDLDIYDCDYKSDIDAKAIILPTMDDVILNKQPVSNTIVLDNNEHIEVKDIRVMKEMFIKQNISYIELLHTKYFIVNSKYIKYVEDLLSIKDDISTINKNQFLRCIKGMSMEKYKALEHPYPTIKDKIDKFGYDPKQLHHILRLNEFVERYLVNKEKLSDCYISNIKDELIRTKKGFYNLEQARILACMYDTKTKELCNEYITEEEVINYKAIDKLNSIVTDILRYSFSSQLEILRGEENE